MTIVDSRCSAPYGELLASNAMAATEHRLLSAVQQINARTFGAIDLSANEHALGGFQSHYMAHSHVLIEANVYQEGEDTFRRHFPGSSPLVDKSVVAKPFDGRRQGIAYPLRQVVDRRISFPSKVGTDGSVIRADTSDKPLKVAQRLELALALDQAGIEARLLLYGYELRTDGRDVWIMPVDRHRADELLSIRHQAAHDRRNRQQAEKRERDLEQRLWLERVSQNNVRPTWRRQ